jgi:hypothetical protein
LAQRFCHYSISITGDIYGHTSDTEARTAIDALGARLGGCPGSAHRRAVQNFVF